MSPCLDFECTGVGVLDDANDCLLYINYVCRLLKEKRAVDESFNRFLEMKRGAAMHTLESLMLLPVSLP